MNISVKSEYALKAVFDLATQSLESRLVEGPMPPVKIADIARRQKIPQKFLELILAGLKQSGFVDSRRGAEGGYLLARAPDLITVGEVLRTVENVKNSAKPNPDDPFSTIWNRVDSAVSEVLDQTSFADLSRAWQERNARYVPNWEI
jgi:Rrf2 family transcriptional regulator, cysteine metabolism repressor